MSDARTTSPKGRPTSAPARGAVLVSSTRAALVPLSLVASAALYYGAGVPLWIVAAAVTAPLFLLYAFAPVIARRQMVRLDREVVRLLAKGDRPGLMRAYQRAIAFRLFGSPALVAERRGLVHAQLGQARDARQAYEQASDGWGGEPPISVTLGLANACYALGDDEAADAPYRELLAKGHRLPVVLHNLGHGLVRRAAKAGKGSKKMLRDAVEIATEGLRVAADGAHEAPLKLTLAEARAALGEKKEARALVDSLGEPNGELGERLATVRAKL